MGRMTPDRRLIIGAAGLILLAALVVGNPADNREAVFFSVVGFACLFPLLLGVGWLAGWLAGRALGAGTWARTACLLVPTIVVSVLLEVEGVRGRDPRARFARHIASPVPPGVRVISAYEYDGMNFHVWAVRFDATPEDLPAILARLAYEHDHDPAGYDFEAESALWRGGPRPGFKAVYRYRHRVVGSRLPSSIRLYADEGRRRFYAYSFVE